MISTQENSLHRRASFATLKRFAGHRHPGERCELCGAEIGSAHRHLMASETRRIVCVCNPCALLFSGGRELRYQALPRAIVHLADFRVTAEQWDALRIPIQLAFFTRGLADSLVTAHFPGPGGPITSSVEPEVWRDLEQENPRLGAMAAEVEALLINRVGAPNDAYLVPFDVALRLSGLIRLNWRGLSGGADVWREIAQFFAGLREGRLHV